MKRQATKYLALTISAIMAVSLTACGDGSDSSADAALTPVEAEPILSDLELEILNLETKSVSYTHLTLPTILRV